MKSGDISGIDQHFPLLLERCQGTKEEKQRFFADRHRVSVPKTNDEVMWSRLVDTIGRANAARAVFDLVLSRARPRLLECLRHAANGAEVELRANDPAVLDSLFFGNGRPRKLGELLVEHAETQGELIEAQRPKLQKPARLVEPDDVNEARDWFDKQRRYARQRRLGNGGMGIVYSALDKNLEREVAVKIIRPEHRKDVEYRARFDREVRAQTRIKHSNILPIFDRGEDFYVAELCRNSLKDELEGHLSVPDLISVALQCC